MRIAAGLAVLLIVMPLSSYAATRVELGAASAVFPRGVPHKIHSTPKDGVQAEARLRAKSPAAADLRAKTDAEIGPIDSWIVSDRAHGVSFLFSVYNEESMPLSVRQANQAKCPASMPAGMPKCRDVRIGDALGKAFDRLGTDGLKSATLSVSKGGRRYLLSYLQLGQDALAHLGAIPGGDDPRVFLDSFRLNGAAPVWP